MYYFLVNPASRSGKGLSLWENTICKALDKREIPHEVRLSARPGDIEKWTRELTSAATAEHPVRIVLMGGDGTINEFLQGVSDFSHVQMGYIPSGSGGDFARGIGYPDDPTKVLDAILACDDPLGTDVGVFTWEEKGETKTRRFAVSGGIGFDAEVCERVNKSKAKVVLNKIGLGKLVYTQMALRCMFFGERGTGSLDLSDGESRNYKKFLFISFMNHRYEGGGFMFGPNADAHDGLLHLCVAKNMLPPVFLRILPSAFEGKQFKFPQMEEISGSHFRVHLTKPLWIHTDGEIPGRTAELEVSIMKQVLQLLY